MLLPKLNYPASSLVLLRQRSAEYRRVRSPAHWSESAAGLSGRLLVFRWWFMGLPREDILPGSRAAPRRDLIVVSPDTSPRQENVLPGAVLCAMGGPPFT